MGELLAEPGEHLDRTTGRAALSPVCPGGTGLVEPQRSLANLTKHDISQLTALIKTRLRRMQYRAGLLDGFLAKTGLDLSNWL